jgi:heme exporter protein D
MTEFLYMGGYGQYVWPVFGLGIFTVVYNVVSARMRFRMSLENARLNAARFRNRQRPARSNDPQSISSGATKGKDV